MFERELTVDHLRLGPHSRAGGNCLAWQLPEPRAVEGVLVEIHWTATNPLHETLALEVQAANGAWKTEGASPLSVGARDLEVHGESPLLIAIMAPEPLGVVAEQQVHVRVEITAEPVDEPVEASCVLSSPREQQPIRNGVPLAAA